MELNYKSKSFLGFLGALFLTLGLSAQVQLPPDRTVCDTGMRQIVATAPILYGTPVSLSDDIHSDLIPLGFDFTYWGTTYDSIVFSSNFYITFDYTKANTYSPWDITDSLHKDPNTPNNAIMCPWTDVHPGLPTSGQILYGTYGTAPNRVFNVTFCELKMFSGNCSQYIFSSQIKIFEATNHFEIHMIEKPACTAWNGGYAIMGLTDQTKTNYMDFAGRNYPDVWTAQNEGWAFFAAGPSAYVYMSIPFDPVTTLDSNSVALLEWFDSDSTTIGYGDTLDLNLVSDTMIWAQLPLCGTDRMSADTMLLSVSNIKPSIDTTTDVGYLACYNDNDGWINGSHIGGFAPVKYNWSNGATSATISNLSAGVYELTLTDLENCEANDTIVIKEPDELLMSLLEASDENCDQANGRILLSSNGGTGTLSYTWSIPGTDSVQNGLAAGTYYYTVTDDNGCARTGSSVINPIPGPIADIWTPFDTVNTSNPVFTFIDSTNGNPSNWEWSFGDGNYAYVQDPVHSYSDVGVFNVVLTVSDSAGCLDTATYRVFVVEEFFYFIPTAFTPNEDNLNTYFVPSFVGISDANFTFLIYDRWGKLVFETNVPTEYWDGTFMNNGEQKVDQGLYAYRVNFMSPSGKEIKERGTIQLIR